MRYALLAIVWLASGAPSAEPLRLVDLEGRRVALGPPAAGEAIVVHFWATWCPQCPDDLAALARAARACAGARVRVAAVDVGEDAETVRGFLSRQSLALPVLLDPKGRAWRRAAGRELPANLTWTAERSDLAFGPRDERAWAEHLAVLGCRS